MARYEQSADDFDKMSETYKCLERCRIPPLMENGVVTVPPYRGPLLGNCLAIFDVQFSIDIYRRLFPRRPSRLIQMRPTIDSFIINAIPLAAADCYLQSPRVVCDSDLRGTSALGSSTLVLVIVHLLPSARLALLQ